MNLSCRSSAVGAALTTWMAFGASARAEPAVLYVPTEDIELHPLGIAPCSSQENSGLGCTTVPELRGVPAYPGAIELRADLAASLAAYDVHIAEERPPEYLAYTMLLPSDDPLPRSQSYTCTAGGINCSSLDRNDIVRVFGPTENCLVSDVLRAALFGFGRASGLEGVADPLDPMFYIPEYVMGSIDFVDGCSDIVNRLGMNDEGEIIPLPQECTSLDHNGCPNDQQNSHADLLEFYGSRVVDVSPPVLTNLSPGDGAVLAPGEQLLMDVDISDSDPVLGGRWTIYSPVLEEAGVQDGTLSRCTNDICDVNWNDALPLKPTDSDWSLTLQDLPEGVYEITFEASDFHGNVTDLVVMNVIVGDPPPPPETTSTSDGMESGGDATTGMTSVGTDPTLDGSGSDDDAIGDGPGTDGPSENDGLVEHGCACRSAPSSGWSGMALLLLVGALRRRTQPEHSC